MENKQKGSLKFAAFKNFKFSGTFSSSRGRCTSASRLDASSWNFAELLFRRSAEKSMLRMVSCPSTTRGTVEQKRTSQRSEHPRVELERVLLLFLVFFFFLCGKYLPYSLEVSVVGGSGRAVLDGGGEAEEGPGLEAPCWLLSARPDTSTCLALPWVKNPAAQQQ